MRRPAPGKRPKQTLDEAALVRRLTGALPRPSAQGRSQLAEWLSSIARTAAGKAVGSIVADHPPLAGLLAGIADAAPYLWDLIRADPARFVRLLGRDPEEGLAALLVAAREATAAAKGSAALMRNLRRMKAEAALLIALADIGGVWPVARVTAALTDVADAALGAAVRYLLRDAAARGKLVPADRATSGGGLRLCRARDGQDGRLRAEFLQRHRPHGLFRSCRSGVGARRRGRAVLRAAHPRSGEAHAGAHGGRLCFPRRSAAAARSGLDPDRDLDRSRARLLREPWTELGTRGADQGAAVRRRRSLPGKDSCASSRPSSGASISITPRSPMSTR